MNLAEIRQQLLAVLVEIDEAEGVLDDDLESRLTEAEGGMADKVEACVSLAQSFDATAEAEKLRASKIQDHARALANKADRLREWVRGNLEAAGIKEMEAGTYKVKLAKVAPSANVDPVVFMSWANDTGRLDLITVKPAPDPTPNKREILAALKRGEDMRGAELITGRTRLAVR